VNHFSRRLAADIPLLTADALAFLIATTGEKDVRAAEHPMFAKYREQMKPKMEKRDVGDGKKIAIVPSQGALAYNPDISEMFFDGVEDSRNVLSMIQDADDDDTVDGILLRMDTPGGMLLGGPEMGDAVKNATKPVVAHIGGMGASLGYMIASQAKEVVASRSAIVGSIGVIASIVDWSSFLAQKGIKFEYFTNEAAKYKAAGAPGAPLTQAQRENIQRGIESAFQLFKSDVKAKRPQVKDEAMQGQTYRGSDAKSVGLVDRVGDEKFAIGVLKSHIRG
jgi:signal peptide peptidase SppA